MNEIAIKRHSFEVAKSRLMEFSEKTEAELIIDKVQTDGDFLGIGNHKVTGDELNRRIETIQENFIAVNTTNNKVIKEFREVYNALDALDKDYITSIVANVKAIEKTSDDVRVQQGILSRHNDQLANQQNKLEVHQEEIEKTVANISKIVMALKGYRKKLENYTHLQDIDNMWADLDICKKNIEEINENIQIQQSELTNLAAVSENHTEALAILSQKLNAAEEYVSDSRTLITERGDLGEEQLADTIQKIKEEVNENIAEMVQTANATIDTLTRRVKYAYWIAGGAAGLAIIEMILLLV